MRTICALGIVALSVLSAGAVTHEADDVTSLTNALKNAAAGDVILLAKGVYDVSSLSRDQTPMSQSGYGHSLLLLNKENLKLVGATGKPEDVVIKAEDSEYRMFNLSASGAALHNITVCGGNASAAHITGANYRSGGAVLFISSGASVSNCVFTGNKAATRGGAVAGLFNYRYGTVYDSVFCGNNAQASESMACDRTTLYRCVFSNNVAESSSSGVCLVTRSNIYDSDFLNNKAPYGCVVARGANDTWKSTVEGCSFLHNTSTSAAGAGTRECTVSNSFFYGNVAPWHGGAIYGGTVVGCTVISNRTANLEQSGNNIPSGGGIYAAELVEASLVASNVCYRGGGVSDCALVRNSTNVYNKASSGGGAYQSSLEGCFVAHNVATGTAIDMNGGGAGGGLAGGSAVNCIFRDNSCSAVYAASLVKNCEIADTSLMATSIVSCVIHGLRNDRIPRAVGNVAYPEGHQTINAYMFGVGKLMRNCLITNCTWTALPDKGYANTALFFPAIEGVTSRVENCSFVDNRYLYLARYASASKAIKFVNSVFVYGETANSLGDVRDFNKTSSYVALLNCAYGKADYSEVTKAEGFEDSECQKIGSIANARFRNRGEHPLMPSRFSPLCGKGLVMNWMSDGVDYAGRPRLRDGSADVGCYQYWPSFNGINVILR